MLKCDYDNLVNFDNNRITIITKILVSVMVTVCCRNKKNKSKNCFTLLWVAFCHSTDRFLFFPSLISFQIRFFNQLNDAAFLQLIYFCVLRALFGNV